MIDQLKDHPNWKMSLKYYYRKYAYRIRLGTFNRHFNLLAELDNYREIDYRQRWDWAYEYAPENKRTHWVCFYTSDERLVGYLLDNYGSYISEINSPIDEKHGDLLGSLDENTIFRKKPYYNKYSLKMESWRTWRSSASDDDVRNAYVFVYDNFSDTAHSRMLPKGYMHHPHTLSRVNSYGQATWMANVGRFVELPTIFTNNESALMLYKLQFGNLLRVKITRVVTL
jgi:hypothetical protein